MLASADRLGAEQGKVRLQWGVKIPLRDGVELNATLYLSENQATPAPAIFTLTPYIGQTFHEFALDFAQHGLPFLTIDVRGRGNSEGTFRPCIQEAQDGHDIVEWLAKQPYCNGQVAMWGGSYAGYDQWATAKEFPPHLATIVPVASPYMGLDFPLAKNIPMPYLLRWLTLVAGRTSQDKLFWGQQLYWNERFREWFESGMPFRSLDQQLGMPSPAFQEWLEHPHPDEYWDSYNPTSEQYAKLSIPILSVCGGINDGNQHGTLKHYTEHLKHASREARARHYLAIGPWDHAGTRVPNAEFGGIKLGPQSLLDLPKLHRQWYAWTMQGGPKPEFLQKNVAYYVMGAERWRYAETLEAITAESKPYFLSAAENPNDVFHSGTLVTETPGEEKPGYYVYDPRDVSRAAMESALDPADLTEQGIVLGAPGRYLIFHSPAFERDTEISGFFKLRAWLSIDQPDTDFYVAVYEVGLDATSVLISHDWLRARYRESLRKEKLIDTAEPLCYDFERFTFVARDVKKGHRLRLVIAPADSIHRERNYNSGGVVAEESIEDARPVTVKLFHDRAHPSALYVPLGHPYSPSEPKAPPGALLPTAQQPVAAIIA